MSQEQPEYDEYDPTEAGFRAYLADVGDYLFPFPDYREYQDEILHHALWHLYVDDFDNIVIDGPTGIGKCITGDTLVTTTMGVVPIEDVEVGDEVISYNDGSMSFETKSVRDIFDKGEKDTFEIETDRGYMIEGTGEHRLKVLDESGELVWCDVDDIEEGDVVPISREPEQGTIQEIQKPAIDEELDRYESRLSGPIQVTESVGELLGWIVADGHGSNGRVEITCATGQGDRISEVFDVAFPDVGTTIADYENKSAVDVRCSSVELCDVVQQHCYTDENEKQIPPQVFASPMDVRASFIRGLFGGDGTYNKAHISFSTVYEELAKDVQQLLRTMGIASQRKAKAGDGDYVSWRVRVTGAELDTFASVVGSFYSESQYDMNDMVGKERNTNIDVLPNVDEKIQSVWDDFVSSDPEADLVDKTGIPKKIDSYRHPSAGPRKPSRESLYGILDFMGVESASSEHLRSLADLPVFFDSVSSIEESTARVYDINVPETHNYVANGFVSHNSPINISIARVAKHLAERKHEYEDHFDRQIPVQFGDAFYTTPQKQLRNQLAEDEDLQEYVRMLKSRRDYICGVTGSNCNDCSVRSDPNQSCMSKMQCTYWNSKVTSMEHPLAAITFAMQIVDNHLPVTDEQGNQMSFADRDTEIVDEAHGLEGQVATMFAGYTVSERKLPEKVFGNVGERADWDDDRFEDVQGYLEDIAIRARKYVDNWDEDPTKQHKVDQCEAFLRSYEYSLEEHAEGRAWVVNVDSLNRVGRSNSKQLTLKPVKVDRFLQNYVWSRGNKRVLSSATIPYRNNIEKWAERIGLPGDTQLIRAPMPFPVEHRQIYTGTMVGEMSGDGEDRYWGDMMAQLREIHQQHQGENGLLHTVSYDRAERVAQALGYDNVIVHDDEKSADKMIEEWQQSSADILASPAMTEGVDLHGDLCRWQALLKVPYAFVGDERVSYLLNEEHDWDWYYQEAAVNIMQSVGRATRGPEPEESSAYYCLDGSFEKVRNKVDFPGWFEEAITDEEPDFWDNPSAAPWRNTSPETSSVASD